ncbi:MAG: hypothetical protein KQH79_11330 [Bacteroidetes bacterium]|nr:hypothetical protein [Bacteroidota bacterium]
MKNRILILAVIGILVSCSEGNNNLSPYHELDGEWNLIYATCGFCGSLYLDVGDYIWTIDTESKTLWVKNNSTAQHPALLDQGMYEFEFNDTTITVLSSEYDYLFDEEKLILYDNPAADGPVLEFIKGN